VLREPLTDRCIKKPPRWESLGGVDVVVESIPAAVANTASFFTLTVFINFVKGLAFREFN